MTLDEQIAELRHLIEILEDAVESEASKEGIYDAVLAIRGWAGAMELGLRNEIVGRAMLETLKDFIPSLFGAA